MHDTAMNHGKLFFETYVSKPEGTTIVDLGSQDVNGSLRSVAPAGANYIGVDFEDAKGVDVVISDPYSLPFENESVDYCVSSSCFEHSEFFWLVFLEIIRILKPAGLLYLNVPYSGAFHRFPVDCWRFYPDSGTALQNWARRNGFPTALMESFVGNREEDKWNDFVAVFVKDEKHAALYPKRIQQSLPKFTNGRIIGRNGFAKFSVFQEHERSVSELLRRKVRRMLRMPV